MSGPPTANIEAGRFTRAARERPAQVEAAHERTGLVDELDRIAVRCASLPWRDHRSADEIIGYDDRGLPE